MDPYILTITIIGVATLFMAWFPSISQRTQISYAIFYVLIGAGLFAIFNNYLPDPDPVLHPEFTTHITELVVIISLMGTGLKIDQPFSFKKWTTPFRLVSITMSLCILTVAFLAIWLLDFDLPSALLLGAVLAPTDPVLASDVQVEPPMEGRQENVKFSLTVEAGMNDGMAFPFVWLAIVMATFGMHSYGDLGNWFLKDVIYRLIAGVICGILLGRLLAMFVFYLPEKKNFVVIKDGFVGIAATLAVYGLTELVQGYGFIAVFISAITLRNYEIGHKYHKKLHEFTDQIERIMVSILLIVFGGSLISGILKPITWPMILLGVIFLFAVRPVTSWIGMIGTKLKPKEKMVISFFGIRGIGSFFYLSFALNQGGFSDKRELWAIVSFIVMLSILIHGLTATRTFRKMEKDAEGSK